MTTTPRRTALPTIALGAVAAGLAVPATAAADRARVEYTDAFSTRTPGSAAGRTFTAEFFDAADPNAKPPPVAHVHVDLPEGARFNTNAVPQCPATDAQVMAEGAAACPAGSRIGGGEIVVDTGFPEPHRTLTSDFTLFNAREAVILMAQDRESGGRVVVRATVRERTLDLDVPPLPGAPPDGGASRRERIVVDPATGPGGAWLTTPPQCPADGAWVMRTTWTFRNGEQQARESRSPCDAAPAAGPGQRITFFHRQRARAGRNGSLRLRARNATGATIAIGRGGQVLRRQGVRLRAGLNRVSLPALQRGRYSVVVTAAGVRRQATLVVR
jgi:hypothetical protein